MSTQLIKTPDGQSESEPQKHEILSVFGSVSGFETAQRMARALCSSPMVPETYRGEGNIGSCIIALEMANRVGASVLSVCQNLYIVHGRPAWSSQFLIACVNASGRFSPLRYKMTGEPGTDSWGCIAWATDKTGERLESPEITIGTAKAEGWFQKNGSKWKTMPELMLRYRTATLFARLYAPELTMGLHVDDEIIDIVEVAPVVTAPTRAPDFSQPTLPAPAIPTTTATSTVLEPAKGKPGRKPKPEAPPAELSAEPPPADLPLMPLGKPEGELPLETAPEQPMQPENPTGDLVQAIRTAGVTEKQVLNFFNKEVRPKSPVAAISEFPVNVIRALTENLRKHEDQNNGVVKSIRAQDPI